jgi:hypothetical protein
MTFATREKQERIITVGSNEHLLIVDKQRKQNKIKCLVGFQIFTTIFFLLMIGIFYAVGYSMIKEMKVFINVTNNTHDNCKQKENIVTLYALDPLARTFCFDDGKYGQMFSDWSVYNRRSDIDFNNYNKGNFSVGIEGGEVGTIIDLGSSADLQKKYKYQETAGNGQGFASIHRKNNTILILKDHPYNHTFQPMEESIELFRDGRSAASASVNLGHLYILRITDHSQTSFERIVKMLVIGYKPNESVTIRWQVLV